MKHGSQSDVPLLWQFSLWHLFGVMTWAAVAAAVVAAAGPGTIPASLALLLGWLNVAGTFESFQRGRRQQAILWSAWILFLISLALPTGAVFQVFYGYQAAWLYLSRVPWAPWSVANILMALTPFMIWRLRHGYGRWLRAALCISMPSVWSIGWNVGDVLWYPGYWVWCASFLVVLVALPVRRWMFVAMIVSGGASALLAIH